MGTKNVKIGKVNDFKEGEMKNVSVGDGNEILVLKTKGKISALGANCTHYGAPLADGILNGDKIICPWHHACFNAHTGDLLEPPAFEALPKFNVQIDEDNVSVDLPDELPGSRTPEMSAKENEDSVYAVIGGGSAGYGAVQAMREAGFKGRIFMFTKENRAPYDRPNLSKDYMEGTAQLEWMPIRPDDFYKKYDIEIEFDKNVKKIAPKAKKITFDDSSDFKFDKLLIATGGIPIKLEVPGADLKNIFYLRSFDDADEILEAIKKSKKAVVIGSSFIGMETANSLFEKKLDVTVISLDKIPFEKTLGKEIGKTIQKEYEKNGIKFLLGRKVKSFAVDSDKSEENVSSVLLDNGEKIDADLVVIGIGVKPATEFIKDAEKTKDGGLKVDNTFKVTDNIYAAGDIASFFDSNLNQYTRIEHWRTAMQHGRIAGFNMADAKEEYSSAPFFWTKQGELTINYVGHAKEWDDIIINGDLNSGEFIAFYAFQDKIIAAAGSNYDKELIAFQELLEKNKLPGASEFKNKNIDLVKLLKN